MLPEKDDEGRQVFMIRPGNTNTAWPEIVSHCRIINKSY